MVGAFYEVVESELSFRRRGQPDTLARNGRWEATGIVPGGNGREFGPKGAGTCVRGGRGAGAGGAPAERRPGDGRT